MAICLVVSEADCFVIFLTYDFVKHVTPGAGPFWPNWHNLYKLGRGPLGDATYQISRP